MDINEGAKGDQVLRVELPDHVDLGDFEAIEDGKSYREWRARAALINEHATVTLMTDNELWDMGANIWRGYDDPNPLVPSPASRLELPNPSRRGRSVTARQCGVSHSYP